MLDNRAGSPVTISHPSEVLLSKARFSFAGEKSDSEIGVSFRKSRSKDHERPVVSIERIREIVHQTLPLSVEAHKVELYYLPFTTPQGYQRTYPFLVLKAFIPDDELDDFFRWRDEFESKHHLSVFPQISPSSPGIKFELQSMLADGKRLLGPEVRAEIRGKIEDHPEPELARHGYSREAIESAIDLRHLKFASVDREGTECREDLVAAVQEGSKLRIFVSFIDVTPFVTPESESDDRAREVLFPLNGRKFRRTLLGERFAHGIGNFTPGEERLGWTIEMTIERGKIEIGEPFRALVINHREYSTSEFGIEARRNPRGMEAKLVKGAETLRGAAGRGTARKVGDTSLGDLVVSEIMIWAKMAFADYLESTELPALFRNQSAPSRSAKMELVRECNNYSVPANLRDFEDPIRLTALLACLDRPEHLPLISKILETFLSTTTVGFTSRGFRAFRGEDYCEIKPHKGYYGLFNQYVLEAALLGKDFPPSSWTPERLKKLEFELNSRLDTRDVALFRYRFLEMLHRKLELVGQTFNASITRVRDDEILFDVNGFSRWGRLDGSEWNQKGKSRRYGVGRNPGAGYAVGMKIAVKLLGFDPESMRFVFAPVSVH